MLTVSASGKRPEKKNTNVTSVLKPAFHDTDIDTDTDSPDTPTSLRPTLALFLARILARMSARISVSLNAAIAPSSTLLMRAFR